MCLNNLTTKKPIIAKEDIICYKQLKFIRSAAPMKDGSPFIGIIDDYKCEGVVSVENRKCYFCTNDKALNGMVCQDKHGYKFSWILDNNVSSIIIDGDEKIIKTFVTRYRESPVSIGETYKSELVLFNSSKNADTEVMQIDIGLHSYVHSYVNKIPASEESYIVVKCIIPKGSKYFIGNFCGADSYASDTLKYINQVNQEINAF